MTDLLMPNAKGPLRHGLAVLATTLLFTSIFLIRNEEMAELILILSPLPLVLVIHPIYQMQNERAPISSQLARFCGLFGVGSVVAISLTGLIVASLGLESLRLHTTLSLVALAMLCLLPIWMGITSCLMLFHPRRERLIQLLGLFGIVSGVSWFILLISTIGYSVGTAGTAAFMWFSGLNIALLLGSFLLWTTGLAIALLRGVDL